VALDNPMMFAPGHNAEWCRLQILQERRRARRVDRVIPLALLAALCLLFF